MEDINIRCTKALKWEWNDAHNGYDAPEETYRLTHGNMFKVIHTEALKFTTSYDWAMLGWNKLQKLGYDFHMWTSDNCAYLNVNDCTEKLLYEDATMEGVITPEQITLAWVTVLEE